MIASVNDMEAEIPTGLSITEEQYTDWRTQISQIKIHYTVFELIHSIKRQIEKYNLQKEEVPHSTLYISDRRWKKIVSLLRTSAFLNETLSLWRTDFRTKAEQYSGRHEVRTQFA